VLPQGTEDSGRRGPGAADRDDEERINSLPAGAVWWREGDRSEPIIARLNLVRIWTAHFLTLSRDSL